MKLKELEDIAYEIATGSTTLETLNVEQWNKCNVEYILWKQLENLGTDFTEDLVSEIATTIISKFQHLCSDYNE